MGGKMTNLLNEEIMAIKHTIACLRKGEVLEPDPSKRAKMKKDIKELNIVLKEKLDQCGDYRG
jgi:hypothetical protein